MRLFLLFKSDNIPDLGGTSLSDNLSGDNWFGMHCAALSMVRVAIVAVVVVVGAVVAVAAVFGVVDDVDCFGVDEVVVVVVEVNVS